MTSAGPPIATEAPRDGDVLYLSFRHPRGPRWLVPRGRALRNAGRHLYQPYKIGGRVFQLQMSLGIGARTVSMDPARLSQLEDEIARHLSVPEVRLAFYVGQQESDERSTLVAMAPTGRPLAFGRLSSRSDDASALAQERDMLETLNGAPTVAPHVPAVLGFDMSDGRILLLVEAGPGRAGPARFTTDHARFLGDLRNQFGAPGTFEESQLAIRAADALEHASTDRPDAWHAVLRGGLERVSQSLRGTRLDLVPAHRDFAPWNTRIGPNGLFVFDWEAARHGYTPNYDYYHFRFSSLVNLGASTRPSRFLDWFRDAPFAAGDLEPAFFLAYLVDYALSRDLGETMSTIADDDRTVLNQLWTALTTMDEWYG